MPVLTRAVTRPAPSGMTGACAACAIREMSVCSVLSERELSRLCSIISTANVEAGGTVISEGEPANDLFNVVRGSVKLYKLLPNGRRQVTGFLFAGDFLGIALNDTYAYSAEAIEPLQLCRFPRRRLEALLAEMPKLERKLLGTTAHELAAAQDQMVLLGRKTARERVATFLVALSKRALRHGRSGESLEVPMSRTDIADYLGLTTETVSRNVTRLRRARLIAAGANNGIVILNPEGLRSLVDGAPD